MNIETGKLNRVLLCGHCDYFDEEASSWWKQLTMAPLAQEVN